jgi:fructan beta-fructosidase
MKNLAVISIVLLFLSFGARAQSDSAYQDKFRPQLHFSPRQRWTNDPNGMVFLNGQYHLFFQYYPDSTVWGPMHWGHTISKDLIHWEEQPIALYPDSLGYIFSGSAVADSNNTSGFGAGGKTPMVAIFTSHDPKGERAKRNDFQNQSIAYSLDNGTTWTKYRDNPVVKNPGITDFRDPSVMWYEPKKKWIMTLATKDCVTFYSSGNLKVWARESVFGKQEGAHGGVWECPNLIRLGEKWVLIVSINPGGPNGGSATQYFTGDFDGRTFTPDSKKLKWIDYGPDDYAGVTWNNTGKRKIFLGWMSNWQYANVVPTTAWRGAMTLPRELALVKVKGEYYVSSQPVKELNELVADEKTIEDISQLGLDTNTLHASGYKIHFTADKLSDFSFSFSNGTGDKVLAGYERSSNRYFIDRTHSGKTDFSEKFTGRHYAPRITDQTNVEMTVVIDNASIELFADNGLTTMTAIFFPDQLLSKVSLTAAPGFVIRKLSLAPLKTIWK